MTYVPPPKKNKKKKEVKKEGEGRTEEKKNKEDDHSTRKLEGLLRFVAGLVKYGQRKILAFSQPKKTPMPFLNNLLKES